MEREVKEHGTTQKKHIAVPTGYLVVLTQGDDVLKNIEALAFKEDIPSASFTGMGFVNVTFGFFDAEARKYHPRRFEGMELVSMHGTIAWQKGKPSIHAHGVVAGRDFQAHGGHILSAEVGTGSVEIAITVYKHRLERTMDADLGANVLQLSE